MTSDAEDLPTFPDELWQHIDLARSNRRGYRAMLKKMDRQRLIDYYWQYEDAAGYLKLEPYTDYMDEEASDDAIDDIAQWVVAQGKDRYYEILRNPDQTPSEVRRPTNAMADIAEVFQERFHEDIPFPEDA